MLNLQWSKLPVLIVWINIHDILQYRIVNHRFTLKFPYIKFDEGYDIRMKTRNFETRLSTLWPSGTVIKNYK